MHKQTPTIEWVVTESDAEWERLCAAPLLNLPADHDHRLRRKRTFWRVTAMLLLLAGLIKVSALAPTSPMAGKSSRPTAPAQWRPPDGAMSASGLVIKNVLYPDYVFGVVQNVAVQNERKAVRFVLYAVHGEPLYRQTRFYQRIGPDWRQTEPDAALWGPARTLETPYLVYHFRQNDEQTVAAVAAQVDALYAAMQRNFGLPLTQKLVITVSVTQRPGITPVLLRPVVELSVPSPTVYLAPVELTDAQILRQSIVLQLVDHLLAQATLPNGYNPTWRPMRKGLQLWQLWDLDLPLTVWREDVTKWLYQEAPTTGSAQLVRLPKRYRALCTAHDLWMASPVQIGIPFWCHGLEQQQSALHWWREREPATHLTQLAVPVSPPTYTERERVTDPVSYPGETVELATLIEYAVVTYGRERLPALVAGLGQYDNWEMLIPAVYGVSSADFEAGWQGYLTAHYGISLP